MTEFLQAVQTLTLIVASVTLLITLFVIGIVSLRVAVEFCSCIGEYLSKKIRQFFNRLE